MHQGAGYTSEKAVSFQLDVFWESSKEFGTDRSMKFGTPLDNDSMNTTCVLFLIAETAL